MTINITPTHITWEDGTRLETYDPIRTVLHEAPIDSIVEAEDGEYPRPAKWIEKTRPKVLKGKGDGFRIKGRAQYDTLSFVSPECSDFRLEHATVECPDAPHGANVYGIQTWMHKGPYTDWALEDVKVEGGFDWAKKTGPYTKAGISFNHMNGLDVVGCRISGIGGEQCLYIRNSGSHPMKHVFIADSFFGSCGRGHIQDVGRPPEGPPAPSLGDLRIRRCAFEDGGLGEGGASITVTGRAGPTYVESCVITCSEKGNGITFWPEYDPGPPWFKDGTPNYGLALVDTTILGNGTHRENVQVSAAEFLFVAGCTITSGASHTGVGNPTAIRLNGGGSMAGHLFPVKSIIPTPADQPNTIKGNVYVGGTLLGGVV